MERNKFKNMSRGVYISLAVCMLIIAGIGIFASVRSVSNIMSENMESLDDLSVNGDILSEYIPPVMELPTVKEETPSIPEPQPVEPIVWSEPIIEGEVQKRFSDGELMYSETMNDYRTHNGIDVSAAEGTAVVSVADGYIKYVGIDPLWGRTISVDHGNGIVTVYKNLSETLPEGIEAGAFVEEGGVLGAVSTGALVEIGENSHLHFEVMSDGVYVDPIEVLSIYE
ncbi:MAG: M23 family metallopeptidase [Clostridia bacterium]|nr:M23 family metallopeptidase [Clostridia bacterium]